MEFYREDLDQSVQISQVFSWGMEMLVEEVKHRPLGGCYAHLVPCIAMPDEEIFAWDRLVSEANAVDLADAQATLERVNELRFDDPEGADFLFSHGSLSSLNLGLSLDELERLADVFPVDPETRLRIQCGGTGVFCRTSTIKARFKPTNFVGCFQQVGELALDELDDEGRRKTLPIFHVFPNTLDLYSTVADLPDGLFGFDMLSTEFEPMMAKAYDRAFADRDSGPTRQICLRAEETLRRSFAIEEKKKKVIVSRKLGQEDLAILRDHFPQFSLEYNPSVDGPHNFAAAHRSCEVRQLVDSFPSTSNVVDIGGNWAVHLINGHSNVHSCCPLLDARDASRETIRHCTASKWVADWPSREAYNLMSHREKRSYADYYKTWGIDKTEVFERYTRCIDNEVNDLKCNNRFESGACQFQASYGIMIHSGYDIPVDALVNGCAHRNIVRVKGTMIADPAMMKDNSGFIPHLKVEWYIGYRGVSKRIFFNFMDDSTISYDHDYDTYMGYLTRTVITSDSGVVYFLEKEKFRTGTLFFDLTRCDTYTPQKWMGLPGIELYRSNAWLEALHDKYVVKLLRVDLINHNSKNCSFRWEDAVFSKDLIDRVVETCFRSIDDIEDQKAHKKNLALIQTHLVSMSQTVILNGATISKHKPINMENFFGLSLSIYFEICNLKRRQEFALDYFLSDFDDSNHKEGFFTRIARSVLPASLFSRIFPGSEKVQTSFIESAVSRVPLIDYLWGAMVTSRGERVSALLGKPNDPRDLLELFKELDRLEILSKHEKDSIPETVSKENTVDEKIAGFKKEDVEASTSEDSDAGEALNPETTFPDHAEAEDQVQLDLKGKALEEFRLPELPLDKDEVTNSVIEFRNYLVKSFNCIIGDLTNVYRNVENVHGLSLTYAADKRDYVIYHRSRGFLLKPEVDLDHQFGFNGKEMVPVVWEGGIPAFDNTTDMIICSNETRLMSGYFMARNLDESEIITKTILPNDRTLVDGVTGCGKTTQIVQEGKTFEKRKLAIFSVCRANVDEIKLKLPEFQKGLIRTTDSYCIRHNVRAPTIFIDEFGLAHSGQIFSVMHWTKCKSVRLFGDTEQIPFVCRVDDFEMKYQDVRKAISWNCEIRNCTYRCPADVTYILSLLYENEKKKNIFTKSSVEKSLTWKKITGVAGIPLPLHFNDSVLYIAHLTADVGALRSHFKKHSIEANVLTSGQASFLLRTTHAGQGLSVPYVVYFRLTRADDDLFTSKKKAYTLVALSRHTRNLCYFTTKPDDDKDLSLKMIRTAMMGTCTVDGRTSMMEEKPLPIERSIGWTQPNLSLVPYQAPPQPSEKALLGSNINDPICVETLFFSLEKEPAVERISFGRGPGNRASIENLIEEVSPGNTSLDDSMDQILVETSPLLADVGSCSVNLSKLCPKIVSTQHARPVLSTSALSKRNSSLYQTILAYEKRNANVPQLNSANNNLANAVKVVESFFTHCINHERFAMIPQGSMGVNPGEIERYFEKTSKPRKAIGEPYVLCQSRLDEYCHMIKRTLKPVMDESVQTEYPKAATITYHGTEITQVASAVFSVVKQRFMFSKADNICVPLDSESDVGAWVSERYTDLSGAYYYELDFSKYDKSQNELHQIIQDLILLEFGVAVNFVATWHVSHRRCRIVDRQVGFKSVVSFQRRTGDAFTFLGNTLCTLAMINFQNPLSETLFTVAGGDDSNMVYAERRSIKLDLMPTLFNMQFKLLNPSAFYFCSRYGVWVRGRCRLVPDPVKLAIKLGRRDIYDNFDAVDEVFLGMQDSCKGMFDDEAIQQLCYLVPIRLKKPLPSLYDALCFMRWALSSKANFRSLFEIKGLEKQKQPISRHIHIT